MRHSTTFEERNSGGVAIKPRGGGQNPRVLTRLNGKGAYQVNGPLIDKGPRSLGGPGTKRKNEPSGSRMRGLLGGPLVEKKPRRVHTIKPTVGGEPLGVKNGSVLERGKEGQGKEKGVEMSTSKTKMG